MKGYWARGGNVLLTSTCLQHGLEWLLSRSLYFFTMQILSIKYCKSLGPMVPQTNSGPIVPSGWVGKNLSSRKFGKIFKLPAKHERVNLNPYRAI